MLFNSDPTKTALRKRQIQTHPVLIINNIQIENILVKYLIINLILKKHIDNTISKVNKDISMIRKLRHSLPLKYLVTIYKVFLRPLIDCRDMIYDQPQNRSFCEKLKPVQYKDVSDYRCDIRYFSR